MKLFYIPEVSKPAVNVTEGDGRFAFTIISGCMVHYLHTSFCFDLCNCFCYWGVIAVLLCLGLIFVIGSQAYDSIQLFSLYIPIKIGFFQE